MRLKPIRDWLSPTPPDQVIEDRIREAVRTHRPMILAPDERVDWRLNPYEAAAVRFRWRQEHQGPELAHIIAEFD